MKLSERLDLEAIRHVSARYGVKRLRAFGSVLTEEFDVESSDIDLLVTFDKDRENVFHDYFDLKAELERLLDRRVDLVVERSIVNPFFKAKALANAQEIYTA